MTILSCLVALLSATLAAAEASSPQHKADYEVRHFVTEPNIKALPWQITEHDPAAVAPGHWFVAPLIVSKIPLPDNREYAPYKTGAQIYDRNGDLIWSMRDQPMPQVQNFQPVDLNNGSQHLTLIVQPGSQSGAGGHSPSARGIVLDHHYEELAQVTTKGANIHQDFHEFHLDPLGKTAIVAAKFADGDRSFQGGNSGFQEMDLETGNVAFQWDPVSAGIGVEESMVSEDRPLENNKNATPDFFHLNSVDKDQGGDYLVSGRHVSTIFKISGKNGSILWRLGGLKSDFTLGPGVNFRYQHDARFRFKNSTHTIISLLDNAVSPHNSTEHLDAQAPKSSGKIILLNTETMTATLLRHFFRPDGGISRKMGNMQVLGNDPMKSSVLVNWASPGGVSEFSSEGRLVLEASMVAGAVTSYRVFKHEFVGSPRDAPVLKVLPAVMGANGEGKSATFYMSWNGATEVRSWKIYISEDVNAQENDDSFELMAELPKRGFETAWTMENGPVGVAFVQALDVNGDVLGKSEMSLITDLRKQLSGEEQEHRAVNFDGIPSNTAWAWAWLMHGCALYGGFTAAHKLLITLRRARRRSGGHGLLHDIDNEK